MEEVYDRLVWSVWASFRKRIETLAFLLSITLSKVKFLLTHLPLRTQVIESLL